MLWMRIGISVSSCHECSSSCRRHSVRRASTEQRLGAELIDPGITDLGRLEQVIYIEDNPICNRRERLIASWP